MLRHHLVFRRCLMVVVAGLGVFVEGTFAEAAKPIGRLLEVEGKVQVRDVAKKPRDAEVFGTIYAEESLELAPKAFVVVSFRNGSCVQISGVATATLKESGVDPITAVKPMKRLVKAQKLIGESMTALDKNIKTGGITLVRSEGLARPSLDVSPINGSTVLTSTPTFVWPAQNDAKSYELILKHDPTDKTGFSATVTRDPRVVYSGQEKLRDDEEYHWEVLVTLKGEELVKSFCKGSFVIATEQTREAAEDLLKLADGLKPPEPSLVALAAIRLEELGLYAEAIRQYERLIELAPQRGEFPAALSELYDKAGRTQDAEKSREMAKTLGFSFAKKTTPNAKPSSQE